MHFWREVYNDLSSYSDAHARLLATANGYHVGPFCSNSNYYTEGAYGYDILFLAYGDSYSTADGTTWSGAYMATGPDGEYPKISMSPTCDSASNTSVSFATPTYSIPTSDYDKPYGRDSYGGRVMLLTQTDKDYASGLLLDQWCKNNGKTQVMVLADVVMAATSAAAGSELCVIAVGSPAVSAIEAENSGLTPYANYADWYSGRTSSPGFINAAGATGYDSYHMAYEAVISAVDQV